MNATPIKLMLLGIGLMLFGLTFYTTFVSLIVFPTLASMLMASTSGLVTKHELDALYTAIDSLFPLAGLILLFVSFFRRETANKA